MRTEDPTSKRIAELEELMARSTEAERLPLLIELSNLILYSDSDRAIALATKAIGVAEKIGEATALSQSLLHASRVLYLQEDLEGSAQLLARAESLLPQDDIDLRITALMRRAGLYHAEDRSLDTINTLTKALDLCGGSHPRMTELMIFSGFVYTGLGLYERALAVLLDALDRLEHAGSERSDLPVMCHVYIADVYGALGDTERMCLHAHRGIACADTSIPSHRPLTSPLYVLLGIGADTIGYSTTALDYFRKSLALLDKNEQLAHQAQILMHIGRTLTKLGERREGMKVLYEALDLAEQVGPPSWGAKIHVAIAEALRSEGDLPDSVVHLTKALKLTEDTAPYVRVWALNILREIHDELDETEASYARYREHIELRDRLYGEEVQRRISRINLEYELRRSESERSILRERAERLEDEAASTRKEILAVALNLIHKQEGLRKLRQELLREARGGLRRRRELIDDLVRKIDEQLARNTNRDWLESRAHSEFMAQLARHAPDLTPTELRMCALLRIDLSTKEIADLLSISLYTANTHRRNIRRKLGLDERDNLTAYLLRLQL